MAGTRRERLLLLDGYALAYRAHHAFFERPLRTSGGENTSVPWGVLRLLRKLLAEESPTYAAFVLDAPGGATFRHARYPAYKATRERATESLEVREFDVAMDRVRRLLAALRIPVVELPGFEADDVIASLAVQATRRGLDAVIVSSDTDFYQLVGDRVFVVEPGRGGRGFVEPQWVDREAATERMGVAPERVIDFLALVGDPSDNVPGVRGIGPKTAAAMLDRLGSLDAILEHADELAQKRAREALRRDGERARLSRDLVALRLDVPVALDLDALRVRPPDNDRLRALYLELEFNSLLPELSPPRPVAPAVEIVGEPPALERLVREARRRGRFGLEPLADSGGPRSARLLGVGLAIEGAGPVYLPLPRDARGSAALRSLLESEDLEVAGSDLAHARTSLRLAGFALRGRLLDCTLLAHLLDPTRRSYDLETLAVERFGSGPAPRPREPAASGEAGARWAAERAALALRLGEALSAELGARGLLGLYARDVAPLARLASDLEWAGVAIDAGLLEALERRIEARADELRREVRELAGGELDPDSPAQLREVLFGRLHLPVKKRTRTGPSTDAEVLAQLAAEGHALPERVLAWRRVSRTLARRVAAVRSRVDPGTRRLHPRFSLTASPAGLPTMSEPDARSFAPGSELGDWLRAAVVAPAGHRLLVARQRQLELRVLAHLSGEATLVEALRAGGDPHAATAARLFGVPAEAVTEGMRATAQVLNEAALAGEGPGALALRLEASFEDAQALVEAYLERLPDLAAWREGQLLRALRDGYVVSMLGRRRGVPELRMAGREVRETGRRAAQTYPLRASAAEVRARALLRLEARLREERKQARIVLVAAEELVLEAGLDEVTAIQRIVRAELQRAEGLAVPLVAELGSGRSWLEAGRAARREPARPLEPGALRP